MCLYCPRNYWYIMYEDDFINNAINVLVSCCHLKPIKKTVPANATLTR